jgi:hypothetical protein
MTGLVPVKASSWENFSFLLQHAIADHRAIRNRMIET